MIRSRRLGKEFNGVVEAVSCNREYLVRFQGGCEKHMTSNQLTNVTVYRISMTEEDEVPMISTKPKEAVDLEKGYYHFVHVLLNFNKEDGANIKEDQIWDPAQHVNFSMSAIILVRHKIETQFYQQVFE